MPDAPDATSGEAGVCLAVPIGRCNSPLDWLLRWNCASNWSDRGVGRKRRARGQSGCWWIRNKVPISVQSARMGIRKGHSGVSRTLETKSSCLPPRATVESSLAAYRSALPEVPETVMMIAWRCSTLVALSSEAHIRFAEPRLLFWCEAQLDSCSPHKRNLGI